MKRLIEFIKKIFSRKKISNKPSEIIVDENTIETSEKINEKNTIKNINWNLINSLKENDIVLVKMKDKEIDKDNIIDNHQKRPFLIQFKQDEYEEVVGYYLTSNTNNALYRKDYTSGLKVILNQENYLLNKNSLIIYEDEINLPYENIIHFISHLHKEDLKKLKKFRELFYGNTITSSKDNILVEIGDIVLDDNKAYIIYQMDNVYCYGYYITIKRKYVDLNKEHDYICFNHNLYHINYKDCKTFKNNDTLDIIGRFNNETVDLIKQNKKTIKYKEKNKTKQKTKKKR